MTSKEMLTCCLVLLVRYVRSYNHLFERLYMFIEAPYKVFLLYRSE